MVDIERRYNQFKYDILEEDNKKIGIIKIYLGGFWNVSVFVHEDSPFEEGFPYFVKKFDNEEEADEKYRELHMEYSN